MEPRNTPSLEEHTMAKEKLPTLTDEEIVVTRKAPRTAIPRKAGPLTADPDGGDDGDESSTES